MTSTNISFFLAHLPAAARLSVVGEVVTDPLVDLAQCHLLLWRAVDGEGDQAGVAVRRLAVLVLLHLLLVQGGVGVQHGALLAHAGPVGVLGIGLADRRLHGQLRQPIHGGQATLQLRRHGDGRLAREKGAGVGGGRGGKLWSVVVVVVAVVVELLLSDLQTSWGRSLVG